MDRMTAEYIDDAVMEVPRGFTIGGEQLCLYPPTLGATIMEGRILAELGLNVQSILRDPYRRAVALMADGRLRSGVAAMLTHATCRSKEEHFDNGLIVRRRTLIEKLPDKDMASLFIIRLRQDRTAEMMSGSGLDAEAEDRSRVARIKADGNTLTFGGDTPFGRVLDAACSRYGWTVEYAVWGVSWSALRMMLADSISTVYMSDKDIKRYRAQGGKTSGRAGGGGAGMNFTQFMSALHGMKRKGGLGE